jgi:hypothetical protein
MKPVLIAYHAILVAAYTVLDVIASWCSTGLRVFGRASNAVEKYAKQIKKEAESK